MNDLMAEWKLTDKITENREFELRVSRALSPYITRPYENDLPFINGHRVYFQTQWAFPLQGKNFCSDGYLSRMSDVTENYFFCVLIKKRFVLIEKWSELEPMDPEQLRAKLIPVKLWCDVVDAVSTKFIPDASRQIQTKDPQNN